MPLGITTITLNFNFNLGSVNCYLVKSGDSYFLIDSGLSLRRQQLLTALENAGCQPGKLKLILVTHGDFDHVGNCAYLREKYAAKIGIHRGESGAVESGDMLRNRKDQAGPLRKIIFSTFKLGKANRFTPDLYLEEGQDLSEYGFEATVLHFPGHSIGSIGILTDEGDLFCGDLLTNTDKLAPNNLIDDPAELIDSLDRLRSMDLHTLYPGHGRPFTVEQFKQFLP
jgi:hydroxyacylglutathione hydrolase